MKQPSLSIGCTGVLTVAALLAGCQTTPPQGGGLQGHLDEVVRQSAQPPLSPAPPPAVSDALLPPIAVPLPPPAGRQPRFDVTVDRAPAREFFLSLVEGTPDNLVVHPDVEGDITLKLKNVTIQEVLDTVRDIYGFDYRRTASGYQVLPATLQTRLFPVNYLNINRTGNSETRVSSGQLVDNAASGDAADLFAVSDGGDASTLASSSVATRSQTDFWTELERTLKAILGLPADAAGDEQGRAVVLSPQSGLVTVRAMPDELRDVERFLETAQNHLQRQVILEARILEVELNDGYRAGIDWAALAEDGNDAALIGQLGGGELPNGASDDRLLDLVDEVSGAFNPFNREGGLGADPFGGAFSAALRIDDFAAFIELLSTQGNVQVLSSPRVATVNNQKAVIKVGQDEFFVTDISSTTVTGTATTTTPDITLTPFFSGIALDVTPQIDQHGNVTLHIHPTVSEVTDQLRVITVAGEVQTLPLALSSIRESDSIIRARSGQVVVIGGLIQDDTREEIAATPFLGDLPVLGSLFRHTRQASRKSELVILLRPIVVGSGSWPDYVQETAERIRRLDRGFHAGGRPRVFGNLGEGVYE